MNVFDGCIGSKYSEKVLPFAFIMVPLSHNIEGSVPNTGLSIVSDVDAVLQDRLQIARGLVACGGDREGAGHDGGIGPSEDQSQYRQEYWEDLPEQMKVCLCKGERAIFTEVLIAPRCAIPNAVDIEPPVWMDACGFSYS